MNRKARRAARKSGSSGGDQGSTSGSGGGIDQLLALALRHAELGQFAEADPLYHQALAVDPRQVAALHGLGHIAYQAGRHEVALDLLERAIAVNDRVPELHYSIAAVFHALGRLPQAAAHCAKAAELRPDFAEAWFGLGNVLAEQGQLAEAATRYRHAIAAQPNFPAALCNLGNALHKLGRTDEAMREWQRAIAADRNFPLPYANLGAALAQQGRHDDAISHYRRALELAPDNAETASDLAKSYAATGDVVQAWDSVRRALTIRESPEAKAAFVSCLKQFRFTADAPEIRDIAARALSEPWERPHLLAGPVAELLKTTPALADCCERVAKAWPRLLAGEELWPPSHRSAIWSDRLLRLLLESAPVCDLGLERFLTCARFALLEDAEAEASAGSAADAPALEFYCALARQCLINDYVYAAGEAELRRAQKLRESLQAALDAGIDVAPLGLVAVAAYDALHGLPRAHKLNARDWPQAVKDLLIQQVDEPQEEVQLRASIPALTPINDAVSRAVREQYEANPYPRWVKAPRGNAPVTVEGYLRGLFPASEFRSTLGSGGRDILVAGCGTGQHAIGVALRYQEARVLAIDLSLASLGYAKRQTRAMGLTHVDYAQADILNAHALGRSFDVIEAAGVLHHLDDPMAGWRVLISLLRPGGFMYVALYSELARQNVKAVRAFIAERGHQRTADDIRRLRQDLTTFDHGLPLESLLASPDFFSTSGCRDLLFHAQEHRLAIPQIKSFLHDNDLKLVGFVLDANVLEHLRRRFPDADASTDLDLLHVYETENPQTFATMYHFWVQKAG